MIFPKLSLSLVLLNLTTSLWGQFERGNGANALGDLINRNSRQHTFSETYRGYASGANTLLADIGQMVDRNELRARLQLHQQLLSGFRTRIDRLNSLLNPAQGISASQRAQFMTELTEARALQLHHQRIAGGIRFRLNFLETNNIPHVPMTPSPPLPAQPHHRIPGPSSILRNVRNRLPSPSSTMNYIRRRPGRAGAIVTGLTVAGYAIYRGIRYLSNPDKGKETLNDVNRPSFQIDITKNKSAYTLNGGLIQESHTSASLLILR